MPVEYEDRIIAYIDILGFKEKINKSLTDNSIISGLHETLATLKEESYPLGNNSTYHSYLSTYITNPKHRENILELTRKKDEVTEITAFSDCIVISLPADNNGIDILFQKVDIVLTKLLLKGSLTRGGITLGKLFHRDNIVFGPSLIEAYILESKIAIYPRALYLTEF